MKIPNPRNIPLTPQAILPAMRTTARQLEEQFKLRETTLEEAWDEDPRTGWILALTMRTETPAGRKAALKFEFRKTPDDGLRVAITPAMRTLEHRFAPAPDLATDCCHHCGRIRSQETPEFTTLQLIDDQPLGWHSCHSCSLCPTCVDVATAIDTKEKAS